MPAERLSAGASRLLLAAWLVGAFALAASREPRVLAAAGLAVTLLFRRGCRRDLGRTLRAVVAPTAGLALLSVGWLWLASGAPPPLAPFGTLVLRTGVIGLATLAVLARVDLLGALAPFPAASRLLSVTLAQIHALRLLAGESRQGLRSRLVRRPGALDLLRGAGGITAALFTLSARNARELGDAMRSRGF